MTGPKPQQPSHELSIAKDPSISLLGMLAVLVSERRLIMACTAAGIIGGVALALVRPKTYTSTFSFLPQSTQDPSRTALAGLAGQLGIPAGALPGAAQSSQLYADILVTRAVLAPIAADSFAAGPDSMTKAPLAELLHVDGDKPPVVLENTLHALRTDVIGSNVTVRTSMVTVQVRTESPYLSLQIGERLLEGLSHFNLVTRQSQAREERRFTEGRLEATRASLRAAEDALQQFLQTNRQFQEAPALAIQKDRLQRAVALQQQVATSLAQQYEENRIREVRDTPVMTIIETPALAARPDPRLWSLILLMGIVAGFCVGVLIVIVRDVWRRERAIGRDPAWAVLSREWKRIRGARGS